jgi:opacity protein-like surface antigen
MKRTVSLSILAIVTLVILAAPVLAAQLFTFDTNSQGWSGDYEGGIGHVATGSMSIPPLPPITKSLMIGNGNLEFWVSYANGYTLTVKMDASTVCTKTITSGWANHSCVINGSGVTHTLSFETQMPGCPPGEICGMGFFPAYIDEISVPEATEGLPFRLWLPLLFRAARWSPIAM